MSDVFSTKLLAKNSTNLDGMSAKSYRSPQFKEDLKTLFLRAGVKVSVSIQYTLTVCSTVCVLYMTMHVCHQYYTLCTNMSIHFFLFSLGRLNKLHKSY